MMTVGIADVEKAHERWCEVTGERPGHFRYFVMMDSFATAAGNTSMQWADGTGEKVIVSDQMGTLVQQLLSTHYVAIVKAHMIRLGLQPDEPSVEVS